MKGIISYCTQIDAKAPSFQVPMIHLAICARRDSIHYALHSPALHHDGVGWLGTSRRGRLAVACVKEGQHL